MRADRSSDLVRTLFQLLLIGALIAGGFWILSPFVAAFGWAATMVVATWPLLLILPGVIGGLIAFGVIGLFIGPVLLAVGYTLLVAWVKDGDAAR